MSVLVVLLVTRLSGGDFGLELASLSSRCGTQARHRLAVAGDGKCPSCDRKYADILVKPSDVGKCLTIAMTAMNDHIASSSKKRNLKEYKRVVCSN